MFVVALILSTITPRLSSTNRDAGLVYIGGSGLIGGGQYSIDGFGADEEDMVLSQTVGFLFFTGANSGLQGRRAESVIWAISKPPKSRTGSFVGG